MTKKEAKETGSRNIGLDVPMPKENCDDHNCPFHGTLLPRGRVFVGRIISAKQPKSTTVEWETRAFLPKYERYEKRRTRVHAHNPPCISAKEGDDVKIAECRPLSKTKNFVIIQKV
jgi:small subunit ribosomal protein S17